MGFFHQRILEQCHPGVKKFLPLAPHVLPWHDKQIESRLSQCIAHHRLYERSLFGKISVYNRLPQQIVDATAVSKFQHELTKMATESCKRGNLQWRHSFHSTSEYWQARRNKIGNKVLTSAEMETMCRLLPWDVDDGCLEVRLFSNLDSGAFSGFFCGTWVVGPRSLSSFFLLPGFLGPRPAVLFPCFPART